MNFKRVTVLALAYFSTTVGAGFASGQEALQYYVSYGTWGVVGATVGLILVPLAVMVILQYGSYLRAQSHREVFNTVMTKWVSKTFDHGLAISQFAIAFVMLAGAGANLQQQFGFPTWVGSGMMVVLVILVGLLNTNKVTYIMGALTPVMVILLVGAAAWSIMQPPTDYAAVNAYAMENIEQPLPNWFLSTANYMGLALFSSVSMALLIGGTEWNSRVAGWAGLVGGVLFAGVMLLVVIGLFFRAEEVGNESLPTLALLNQMHPLIGLLASIMTYLMIFSTALGLLYSLGKRVSVKQPKRYPLYFIPLTLIAFALSFFDFVTLVGTIFPILGWAGLALIVTLCGTWIYRGRNRIRQEFQRRDRVRSLIPKTIDPHGELSGQEASDLERHLDASPVDRDVLYTDIVKDVKTRPRK